MGFQLRKNGRPCGGQALSSPTLPKCGTGGPYVSQCGAHRPLLVREWLSLMTCIVNNHFSRRGAIYRMGVSRSSRPATDMLHGYIPPHRFLSYLSWIDIDALPDRKNTVIVLPCG